jgi:hypothetical protein
LSKQHEAHPHEPFIKRFAFTDGTVYETCKAVINGKQCRYATGQGRDPAVICRKHTFGDIEDASQLDGGTAPVIEDDVEPETVREISVEDWNSKAAPDIEEEPEEQEDDADRVEDGDEARVSDDESDDVEESAQAEIQKESEVF